MKKGFCEWTDHALSPLAKLLRLIDLCEEPELQFNDSEESVGSNICRVVDYTTLFIAWEYDEPLEISVELLNGNLFPAVRIELVSDGTFVSGLSRHARVLLHCGRHFATINWHWVHNRPPRAVPRFHGTPVLREAGRVEIKPAASEEKLRRLFAECFGVEQTDSFDRWHHASKGAIRALLLKKLGGDFEITEGVIERLSSRQFEDHFADYWEQMYALYDYLLDDHDWLWASKHLVPPRSTSR